MNFFSFLFLCLSLFFISCSDQKGVLESTSGVIQTDMKPTILFDTEVTKNNNNPISANGEIQINDSYFVGSYVFNNGNRITLLPDEPFSADKNYNIKIDFDLINRNSDSNIGLKNFKMNFKTAPLEAQFQNVNFIRDTQLLDKLKLEAKLELSQNVPLKDIKKNLKLLNPNGSEIEIDINKDSNQTNIYNISSILLDSPKEKDEIYNLVLKKDIGLQKEISTQITASKSLSLEVIDMKVSNGDNISIAIKFSEALINDANLSNFIKISPKVKFSVSQAENIIYIIISYVYALYMLYLFEEKRYK